MKTILIEEAYRPAKVRDGNQEVTIPTVRAVPRSMALMAAKGHARPQGMFTTLLQATEKEQKARHDEWLKTAIEYKTNWESKLKWRKAHGIVSPDPIPHPDDIIIDMKTGEVHIKGPLTKEEKAHWDWLRDRKEAFKMSILELEKMLKENPKGRHNHLIREGIAREKRILEGISTIVPD